MAERRIRWQNDFINVTKFSAKILKEATAPKYLYVFNVKYAGKRFQDVFNFTFYAAENIFPVFLWPFREKVVLLQRTSRKRCVSRRNPAG